MLYQVAKLACWRCKMYVKYKELLIFILQHEKLSSIIRFKYL